MSDKQISLIEFILEEERQVKHARGTFTLLLTQLEYAAKIIASRVRKAGLTDILGGTGKTNVFSEEVQKIDEFSNNLLIDVLSATGQVAAIGSEELPDVIYPNGSLDKGEYIIFLDPLDGSSNTDINAPIGTIFSIYHNKGTLLCQGKDQVGAGYILYSSSTMFVYSCGHGVNGFTLRTSIGSFLLSHPKMRIPQEGNIYSINEGNSREWDGKVAQYLDSLKKEGKNYKSRYIGSMTADIHRTLIKGGIFLYPADKKNPKGKLRLLYEVNPMSFLVAQAGGAATTGADDPLSLHPTSLQERVPIALGSKKNVEEFLQFLSS